jgi:hypothetical protein
MSTNSLQDFQGIADGVVQLRFSNEENTVSDINAAEFAEVLQGLVEFTSQLAKVGSFGDGMAPVVRVRPPVEGSFIVDAVIASYGADPVETVGTIVATAAGVGQAINVAVKRLRGDIVTDFEYLDNGNVKLNWRDGSVSEVPEQAWKELKNVKVSTRKALRKIMAPLSDDVSRLEVRDGSVDESSDEVLQSVPEIVMSRADYYTAVAEIDDESTEIEQLEAEAQLRSIDFRRGEKWRVETPLGNRLATIEDEDFLLRLDRGMALHKNDIFNVLIRETRTTKNGRTTKDWSITQVTFTRRGDDDGDGEHASEAS